MSQDKEPARRVVITGASGAYGRELAARFSAAGYSLVLVDLMPQYDFHEDLVGQTEVSYHSCDFEDAHAVTLLADRVLEGGTPWALINNAGIFPFDELIEVAPDAMASVLKVNFIAPVILSQRLGAAMAEAGGGSICNISSGAAEVVRSNGAIYGASKAALEHITRSFAVTLGSGGVCVNAVRPGLRTRNLLAPLAAGHQARIKANIPLKRLSEEGELASLVQFLCSDEGRFITGQVIGVDGGNAINRRVRVEGGTQ